ncbi:MAG: enoyl-CoA hydratase/isomerase family protein [Betaproteobacteria bacterium]|nr:enoyl-CoA hydratase/isomerase family protein [Betaproteobacteria bacterium]
MAYKELIYAVKDKVAVLTLNRPHRMNAFSPSLEAELHRAFDEADADRGVKVIILTGAGDSFCTGADLDAAGPDQKQASKLTLNPKGKSIAEYLELWQRNDSARLGKWMHMWRLGKPIIAAVNGWALGLGFWYQLAADITIASDKAVFAQPEVRHVSNTSFMFVALCGWKAANRWALTGDHFDANEAYRIGMVNQVVPHHTLMQEAMKLARRMALVPEPSLRLNKAIAMMGMQAAGMHAGLLLEGTLSTLAHASHNEERERLFEAQREGGLKAYLKLRDGPFFPEPMGPRSAGRPKSKARKKKRDAGD